ncbi:MAG: LacI family DNA-binding transcriptional regulator [Christensenellales bacterium]
MTNRQEKRYISIRDIAEISGASIATVSRVINNPGQVSTHTQKKVLDVINKYGYVPYRGLTNISSGASNTIAIFVFDIMNPFFSNIITHLSRITFENNYSLLICNAENDYEKELKYYEYCKGMRVGGIIYTSGSTRTEPPVSERLSVPTVIMATSENIQKDRYVINSDHMKSMRLLVDYLYNLGHRIIGFISGASSFLPATDRLNAFKCNMDRYGLECPEEYIYYGDFYMKSGVKAFDFFYSQGKMPTAIISANDQMAKGFIMRANYLGVRIPDDISLCGIDAIENDYFYPKITSIKQNTELFAQKAFELIINSDKIKPPQEIILDVSIEIGSTCRKI